MFGQIKLEKNQQVDHFTWSRETLCIGIVNVMLTGPDSFVILTVKKIN